MFSIAFVAACGGGAYSGGGKSTAVPTAGSTNSQQAGGGNTITVKAEDFKFDPSTLQVQAGMPLRITLENDGKVAHTFTISELDIDQEVQPGRQATVQVTAPQAGTLTFFCRFHQNRGMTGTLTVTGSGSSAPTSMPTQAAGGSSGAGSGY